jgi:thioredoxin 1
MTLQITDANLEEVLQTDKLVVIDFYADWCGPCKVVGPIIDEVSKEYKDKVVIGKVDVDNNDEAATKYNIRNIPTILFIKNREIVDKVVGITFKKPLVEKIDQLLLTN